MANEQVPLYADMLAEIGRRHKAGNRNYVFAYAASWVNIVSGMLAAIFAAVGETTLGASAPRVPWQVVIATLAAIPVASTAALTTFDVREKIKWYWNAKTEIGALLAELRDDPSASIQTISVRFSELKKRYDLSFPGFSDKPPS